MLKKFWNYKLKGLLGFLYQLFPSIYFNILDYTSTYVGCLNINCCKNVIIQSKVIIRYPSNITLDTNVHISREVIFTSEIADSTLKIGRNTQISKKCHIDFSGNLQIGDNCVVSEDVMIQTHTHGVNPKNKPIPLPLEIKDNVWIGTRSTILHNVNSIGKNSIIAACSVVTKDVPDNVIVAGNPAIVIRELK